MTDQKNSNSDNAQEASEGKKRRLIMKVDWTMPGTIKGKIVFQVVFLSFISIFIVGIVSVLTYRSSIQKAVNSQLHLLSHNKSQAIESYLISIKTDMQLFSSSQNIESVYTRLAEAKQRFGIENQRYKAVESEFDRRIGTLIKDKQYNNFMLVSPSGDVVYSHLKRIDLGSNLLNDNFKNTSAGKCFQGSTDSYAFSDFDIYLPNSNLPTAFAGAPFKNDDNRFVCTILLEISIDKLNSLLKFSSDIGKSSEVYVVKNDSLIIASSNYSKDTFGSAENADISKMLRNEDADNFVSDDYVDAKVMGSFTKVEDGLINYSVISKVRFSEVFLGNNILLGIDLLVLILALIASWFVSKILAEKITDPIKKFQDLSSVIAKGDLTQTINVDSITELGNLSQSFNEMINSLSKTVYGLWEMANQISVSANEMSTTVEQQGATILAQGESINSTSSTVEELAATARQVAESAEKVTNQIEISAKKVSLLSEKASQIGKVISTIEEITERINLLSLNASIEAVRAGEHGKSFAVVASEIRKLAENTAKSTEDIIILIEDIQNSTTDAVLSTDQAVDYVKKIKDAIYQHNIATQHVDSSMIEINEGMKKTTDGITQTIDVIEGLNRMATEMKELVSDFKIK